MTSIDEASGAVGGNAEQARELAGGIAASKQSLDELTAQTSALGMESKAQQAQAASERAGELSDNANALADALDALRSQIDALKDLLAGAAPTASSAKAPPQDSAPESTSGGETSQPAGPPSIKGPAASTTPTRVGKRHLFDQIRMNSPAKEKNTVVLPGVDTDADIEAIKSGRATHLRDNLYEVNDRVYGLETPSGTVYPVRGDGFVELDKLAFTAFKGLRTYDGDRTAAERDPKIARFRRHMTDQTWERAHDAFEQGQRRT